MGLQFRLKGWFGPS